MRTNPFRSPLARRSLAATASLAAAVTGLAFATSVAEANPAAGNLVISEVYGAGGNLNAAYNADFVELYNPTSRSISLDGWSVQYRSATGTTPTVTTLTGSVPGGHHYLVKMSGGTTGAALPTPDAVGSAAMSGSNGVVLLVATSTPFTATGDLAGNPAVVDAVGYGNTPTTYETHNTGVALTAGTAASRTAIGADTDDNAADFSEVAPTPQSCDCADAPEEFDGSIAEIQGTGATSPHVGDLATTEGVVTAAYPTGGFNGFYIQTPGTGGGEDATPGASDAIFVYGSAATAQVARGDLVEITGLVSEFNGTTELTPGHATDVRVLPDEHAPVTPLAATLPASEADREAHEGELFLPAGAFTVTDNYSLNQYGEIGLAAGTHTLVTPTEVADAGSPEAAAVAADNAARGVYLDDASSTNFLSSANQDVPLPYLTPDNPVRVGSPVTFTAPVVLEYRNRQWNFQPTAQLTAAGTPPVTIANTRPENAAPQPVGGNIRLATFNVLNYFNTTGADYEAASGDHCKYYLDRDGEPVTVDECEEGGPRGAADEEDLQRQRIKIVTAINRLGASIVSLEEIENSVALGEADRDDALASLVDALNAAAGSQVWAYVPSPPASELPPTAEQDVIRTAFIYKPDQVTPVGASKVLVGASAFGNAREPLAQGFRAVGAAPDTTFAVIVNHFKSKGSGVDDGTGQGNANPDRVAQAHALVDFASGFAEQLGTDRVFLTGDFNSYSQEDPMQVLYGAGFIPVESDTPGEATYSFDGMTGSLDHVLATEAAFATVTGADVWNINSVESPAFEYSRYNYNATDFYRPDQFRASDHDPEIVGIDTRSASSLQVTTTPTRVWAGTTQVRVHIAVTADGFGPTGTVTVQTEGRTFHGTLSDEGEARVDLPAYATAGTKTLVVSYEGDGQVGGSQQTVTLEVSAK